MRLRTVTHGAKLVRQPSAFARLLKRPAGVRRRPAQQTNICLWSARYRGVRGALGTCKMRYDKFRMPSSHNTALTGIL